MPSKVFSAKLTDLELCRKFDTGLSDAILLKLINEQKIILLSDNDQVIGYLRYSLFWNAIPYVDLIYIKKDHRKKGVGKALYAYLEEHLKQQGFHKLMTSSQSNEQDPLSFHKKIGFEPIGSLSKLNSDGSEEIFFLKSF